MDMMHNFLMAAMGREMHLVNNTMHMQAKQFQPLAFLGCYNMWHRKVEV